MDVVNKFTQVCIVITYLAKNKNCHLENLEKSYEVQQQQHIIDYGNGESPRG